MLHIPPTPRTPASHSPRYKSLPTRIKAPEDTIFQATLLPKSKTTFSNDITPTRILARVRASSIENIFELAKTASIFTEENPLIPSLKRHIYNIKDEGEVRKLALFFSHYLKNCQMAEILKFADEIRSINEKCHSKMEHVPFETRLKIRYKEFYAQEFIRLFKSSMERNLVVYEKYCLGYQWFTEFQFVAHAIKEDISAISPENYTYLLKFIIKLAVYSDVKESTFKKYFEPVFKITTKCTLPEFQKDAELINEIISLYTIEEIRSKSITDNELQFLELVPLTLSQPSAYITWESMLSLNPTELKKEKVERVLNWSQILKNVRSKGCNPEIALMVAKDLETLSITYFKEVTLSNFCHLNRGVNWISKLQKYWNSVSVFARTTIEASTKKERGTPRKSITEFIVEIAYQSFELHDLQTSSALILGINGCKKLPKLSKSFKNKLDTLTEKFHLAHQNENLRKEIRELETRNILYIPYLPLISKEIEMVHNGNPDIVGRQINEQKLKFITRTFEKFLALQAKFIEKKSSYTDILFELRDNEQV